MDIFSRRKYLLTFFIILTLQLAVIISYGNSKEGLFVDEIWSFNFANHYYYPFQGVEGSDSKYFNHWLTAKEWNKALTVSVGKEFEFGSVFFNLSKDIHPPLFFVILHAVCSFFPEQYSKWLGYAPNILFFLFSQIVLAFCVEKIEKDKIKVLCVCLLYGFSWGIVNNVLLIRQYMLMTLLGLLAVLLHISLLEIRNNKISVIKFACIYLITVCGILTHYYFLIFQFFLSAFSFLLCIFRKEFKVCKIYSAVMVSAIFSCVLIFTPMLDHFLGKTSQGWQIKSAVKNLAHSSFLNQLNVFFNIIDKDLFGNLAILVLLIVLFSILRKYIVVIKSESNENQYKLSVSFDNIYKDLPKNVFLDFTNVKTCFYAIMVPTMICYFLTIVKIAPFNSPRYIYIIYPFIPWLLVMFLFSCLQNLYNKKTVFCMILFLAILFSANVYSVSNLSFIDHSYKNIISQTHKNEKNIAFIGIVKDRGWFPIIEKVLLMSKIPHSYLIEEKNIKKLGNILKDYSKKNKSILIYRAYNCKTPQDKVLGTINKITPYKKVRALGGHTFLFQK